MQTFLALKEGVLNVTYILNSDLESCYPNLFCRFSSGARGGGGNMLSFVYVSSEVLLCAVFMVVFEEGIRRFQYV